MQTGSYASTTEICKELICVFVNVYQSSIYRSPNTPMKQKAKLPIIYTCSATLWYFCFNTYILDMTNDGSQCDSSASSCFFNGSPGSPEFPATTD